VRLGGPLDIHEVVQTYTCAIWDAMRNDSKTKIPRRCLKYTWLIIGRTRNQAPIILLIVETPVSRYQDLFFSKPSLSTSTGACYAHPSGGIHIGIQIMAIVLIDADVENKSEI
jgi:hypothetical protein